MLLTAAILFVAAAVQGMLGFALAVVAIPILVWNGTPLSDAIALSASSTLIQALSGAVKLRHSIPWPEVRSSTLIRLLMLPLGILTLKQLHGLSPETIRGVLGLCLITASLLVWKRPHPTKRSQSQRWDLLAFGSSGFFAGMVGMGGPPLVVWLASRPWTAPTIKGFLFANFVLLAPINLMLIGFAFGASAVHAMGQGLLLAPVVVAGSLLGVHLGRHLPRERFRHLLLAALMGIGASAIFTALR